MVLTFGIGLLYALYTTVIPTKELNLARKKYKTGAVMRKPQNLQILYRSFQILNANIICFIRPIIMVAHGAGVVLPIFCNFIRIRHLKILYRVSTGSIIIMGLFTFGFWTMVLQFGKYLFVRGNKTLGSWKRQSWGDSRENNLMKRFRISCRLVLVRCSNPLVIGRITQLGFCQGYYEGNA